MSPGKTRIKKPKTRQNRKAKDKNSDRDLLKNQSNKIEKEIIKIKSQNLGRAGSIFKMRDVINGPRKSAQGPTAIKDPNSDKLIVSNEGIKKVTLAYCVDNLTHKSKGKSINKGLELKKELHEKRMEDTDSEGFELSKRDFVEVVNKFEKKKTNSYDFLIKAGKQYKESVYKVCKSMIEREEYPDSFRRTMLHMIWKQKGPAEILKNSRFIHMKDSY